MRTFTELGCDRTGIYRLVLYRRSIGTTSTAKRSGTKSATWSRWGKIVPQGKSRREALSVLKCSGFLPCRDDGTHIQCPLLSVPTAMVSEHMYITEQTKTRAYVRA